jgi:hypothetical protein
VLELKAAEGQLVLRDFGSAEQANAAYEALETATADDPDLRLTRRDLWGAGGVGYSVVKVDGHPRGTFGRELRPHSRLEPVR